MTAALVVWFSRSPSTASRTHGRLVADVTHSVGGGDDAAGLMIAREPTTESESDADADADADAEADADADAESDAGAEAEAEAEAETETRRAPPFQQTDNYLLIGTDRSRSGWGRADTLVVAVVDRPAGHVGLISIPRDLYVQVPEHGGARINAILRIAQRLDREPLELAAEQIEQTLAIPIAHALIVNLQLLERVVDELGGVTVEVPCPIRDNFIDDRTATGRRLLDVQAGRRHLDGITTAMYVRSRHGRSDWDRARRQQAVLRGLRARIRTVGAARWIPVLVGVLNDGLETTMSRWELIRLGHRLRGVRPERLHGVLIGTRQTDARTIDGKYVLVPDFDEIDRQLEGLFEAPAPGIPPPRKRCLAADAALRRLPRATTPSQN